MANQTVTQDNITIHGRGSLVLPYKLMQKTADGKTVQVDLSTRTLYFEVDGLPIPIRELLVTDPVDPLGKLIVIENAQVVSLTTRGTRATVVDATNAAADLPVVLWNGKIGRDGYVGVPDKTEDA